ncbi:hypothetical protein [Halomarina ordinaria]|uniref:Uncharacterized protein n=1 Tax=Halomarina ordinaria TaxID=3033939 RepID=A0ABD5UCV1_9EURY|nr:hypothetical protein [Halomarina sp. PSRA2]
MDGVHPTVIDDDVVEGRLLTDGGEEEDEGESGDDGESGGEGETTSVLDLDLDGLDLDLLGLEVHLDDVNLDVEAVEAEGNLVGNLLSAVAHLLDGGLQDLLNGLLNPLEGLGEDVRERLSNAFEGLSDSASGTLGSLPLRELFVEVLVSVVKQLLSSGSSDDGNGGDEASA